MGPYYIAINTKGYIVIYGARITSTRGELILIKHRFSSLSTALITAPC